MSAFIAAEDRAVLERHGLASYDALWALQLEAVDEPNTERGGWSSVYRLDLGEAVGVELVGMDQVVVLGQPAAEFAEASGMPREVMNDPAVVSAYLGTPHG